MERPPDDHQPDDRPQPGGDVDEFDAIVSAWRREGPVPAWPDDPPTSDVADAQARTATPPADEGHFVPPEPPPLPRIGPPAAVGLVLLVLGVVLVSAPGWLGVSDAYGLPLGLLTLAAALAWLVLRLWPTAPETGDHDDGAVL